MKYNGIKIYKRTDGRWEAKKQINGNRISICRNTQAEVYEEIKNLFPKSEPTKISKITTFFDYIDFWLEKYKKPFMKKKRIFNYESVIKHQIKPYFKDINMQNFTIAEINLAIKNIPNTRQKEDATQIIKNIFKQAYRDKKIKFDIYNEITKYQHKREEGKALTLEQRKILIEKSKLIENGEIFVFYLFTGARASEILNINPTTDITKDMIHLPGTKTDLSDRWVPILTNKRNLKEKRFDTKQTLYHLL